jgi:hypothetical protein
VRNRFGKDSFKRARNAILTRRKLLVTLSLTPLALVLFRFRFLFEQIWALGAWPARLGSPKTRMPRETGCR